MATGALCRCKCYLRKDVVVRSAYLIMNGTRSCGCLRNELIHTYTRTHGKTKTRLHRIWHCMKNRCYYKNDIGYARYGGRGISVCEKWRNDFQAFYDWAMANGYSDNLSIDRIDVNGNYCPENCRWADKKTQMRNYTKKQRPLKSKKRTLLNSLNLLALKSKFPGPAKYHRSIKMLNKSIKQEGGGISPNFSPCTASHLAFPIACITRSLSSAWL